MKKVKFNVVGRKASLISDKYSADMKKFFSFSVPNYRYMPAYRSGGWDGRISMMQRNTVGVGLLRGMKDELAKVGWNAKIKVWKNRPKVVLKDKGIISTDKRYAYQNDCVKAMIDAIPWGGGLVLSATGTGKTAISSMLASWVDGSILFVVDQLILLDQAKKEMEDWLHTEVGIVGASKFVPQRVTCATIQTLHTHRNDPKFLSWFKTIDIVIIDEIHVQMSARNFNVIHLVKPKAVFGLTATLHLRKKPVRMKAYSICGPTVYEFPLKEATAQGVLTKGCAIQVRIACDEVLEAQRPSWYYSLQVKQTIKVNVDYKLDVVRNDTVNSAILSLAIEGIKRGKYVAILVDRIRHLSLLKKALKELGYKPQVLWGKAERNARERRKERFEKGDSRLLLATKVFTKGVNIKRLDVIIDAAQKSNRNDTQQKYGRGVRLHVDKDGLLHFDIVSAYAIEPLKTEKKLPRTEKAAKSRYLALKKLGIPITKIAFINAKKTYDAAEKLLHSPMKGHK